jgi:hypothetical protein
MRLALSFAECVNRMHMLHITHRHIKNDNVNVIVDLAAACVEG